jgi:LPS sulfotransferase NodH
MYQSSGGFSMAGHDAGERFAAIDLLSFPVKPDRMLPQAAEMVEREADLLDRRFDLPSAPVRLRFLIMSQPRSGSTMLCSALRETGLAGFPTEYLTPQATESLPRPLTPEVLAAYLGDLDTRRTTANGVFGIKLHYGHFKQFFIVDGKITEQGQRFLHSFSHVIRMRRQDKIAQAISLHMAARLDRWNSTDADRQGQQNYEFRSADVPALLRDLHTAVLQDQAWRTICAALGLKTAEVVYEALASSPRQEVERVLAFLGIDAAYQPPRTVKLSLDSNGEAKRRFLAELGVVLPDGA